MLSFARRTALLGFLVSAVLAAACGGAVSSPAPDPTPGPSPSSPASPSPSASETPVPASPPSPNRPSEPIALIGTETLSFAYGAGGPPAPCPGANGDVVTARILIDLGAGSAARTSAATVCGTSAGPSWNAPTTSTTVTAPLTPSAKASLMAAIGALQPRPSPGCGEDGDNVTLTVIRGPGTTYSFATAFDDGCEAPNPVVDYQQMENLFTLANAIF